MYEICVQCGKRQGPPFSVIAIMNMEHAADPTQALAENGLWMAFPICNECHQRPQIKAHFAPRTHMHEFLVAARDQILREG